MSISNPGILKSQARTRLQDTPAPKLVACHTGVVLLLSVVASALHLFLDNQIGSTSGLSGLQTRSMLQTIQTVLQYGTTLFTPFWNAGFALVTLKLATGQLPAYRDLTGGFRRWGAILGQQFFTTFLMFGIAISTGYSAALIFALTPFAKGLEEAIVPMMESGTFDISLIPEQVIMDAYLPMILIYLALLLPLIIFFLLNFRLSTYMILDNPKLTGTLAMRASTFAMRGHRIQMLKLDLSFWWYYLIELILAGVCYLDLILPLLGVQLPINETVAYFGAMILYAILELLFHMWKKPYVHTAYALAYQQIIHSLESPETEL